MVTLRAESEIISQWTFTSRAEARRRMNPAPRGAGFSLRGTSVPPVRGFLQVQTLVDNLLKILVECLWNGGPHSTSARNTRPSGSANPHPGPSSRPWHRYRDRAHVPGCSVGRPRLALSIAATPGAGGPDSFGMG